MNLNAVANEFEALFGLENPIPDIVHDFSEGYSPIYIKPDVQGFEYKSAFSTGTQVPIIYVDAGRTVFDTARWGLESRIGESVEVEYWRKANTRLGYPALIPASYFDVPTLDHKGLRTGSARVRSKRGETLYVGAEFRRSESATVSYVLPLMIEAGEDLKEISAWQPLLISKAGAPVSVRSGIILFINPSNDSRHLQKPFKKGELAVEVMEMASA
jgi:hypothetical protein